MSVISLTIISFHTGYIISDITRKNTFNSYSDISLTTIRTLLLTASRSVDSTATSTKLPALLLPPSSTRTGRMSSGQDTI